MSLAPGSSPFRNRIVLAVIATLVVAAVVVTPVAIIKKKRAETARREAERIEQVEREARETEELARLERETQKRQDALAQEQARIAQQELVYQETVTRAEDEKKVRAEQARREEERRAAEQARIEREREIAEQERLEEEARLAAERERERERAEEERRRAAEEQARLEAEEQAKLQLEAEEQRKAEEDAARAADAAAALEEDDDTPEIETESTLDDASTTLGVRSDGDIRGIYDYRDVADRQGGNEVTDTAGIRWRLGMDWKFKRGMRLGARLAGLCFIDECDFEFVMQSAAPTRNGLARGQFTFDELYVHFFRRERFDFVIGRMQTRFVLRSGVYAKSHDRNDSHNHRVTWTDGMHATYRARKGWINNVIFQYNDPDGAGAIRRGPLDFDDSDARITYFYGLENRRSWRKVVQRGFDISYLPSTLLKDGDLDGRREDYLGLVGRMVFRWPNRSEGPRLRGGFEIAYAPETPTNQAMNLSPPITASVSSTRRPVPDGCWRRSSAPTRISPRSATCGGRIASRCWRFGCGDAKT
jgi:hypothetical protein